MKGTEQSGCQGEQGGWEDKIPGVQPIRSKGSQSLASPNSQRPHTKWKEQLTTWHSRKKKYQFSMAFLFWAVLLLAPLHPSPSTPTGSAMARVPHPGESGGCNSSMPDTCASSSERAGRSGRLGRNVFLLTPT